MASSGKGSKKPTITLSKVPSVRELLERLGFQQASLKDTNIFTDATHAWRKSYRTSNGTSGTDLLLWNESAVQIDLTVMAERFLEDKGNGERFWSPTRSWNRESDLQYPEDRTEIIELLKQLFWKQNRYFANNNIYGHKGIDGREGSRDSTIPVHQSSHREGNILRATSPMTDQMPQHQANWGEAQAAEKFTKRSPIRSRADTRPIPASQKPKTTADSHVTDYDDRTEGLPISGEKDIYEISDEDSVDVNRQLPKSPAQASKRRRNVASCNVTPRKKRKSGKEVTQRRTERKRPPRNRPGIVPYISDERFEEIMKTPSPPPNSPLELEMDEGRSKNKLHDSERGYEESIGASPNNSYSQSTTREKPFAAPTAPMIVAGGIDDPLLPWEAPQPLASTVLASKSQANSSSDLSPRYPPSKIVHLHLKRKERQSRSADKLQPESSLVGTTLPPQGNHETLTEPSNASQSTVENDVGSNFKLYASHTASRSTLEEGAAARNPSSATPLPTSESIQPSSPSPGVSRPYSSAKSAVEARMAEIERNKSSQGDHQTLKSYQDERNSPAENLSSKPRPKTQVPLWIITREPRYTEERWDDGKFQGTQLSDFLEEVSKVTQRNHIEKLKLTLRTPTFDTKITVFKDAEDSWISAKETFVEKLKEARAEAKAKRPNEPASYKILIEPFYEEGAEMNSKVDEDDEEFFF